MDIFFLVGGDTPPEWLAEKLTRGDVKVFAEGGMIVIILEPSAKDIVPVLIEAGATKMEMLPFSIKAVALQLKEQTRDSAGLPVEQNLTHDEAMVLLEYGTVYRAGPEPFYEYVVKLAGQKIQIALRCFATWGMYFLFEEEAKTFWQSGQTIETALLAVFKDKVGQDPAPYMGAEINTHRIVYTRERAGRIISSFKKIILVKTE